MIEDCHCWKAVEENLVKSNKKGEQHLSARHEKV